MPTALILGSNTAVGAYLARLLHARGTTVFGAAISVNPAMASDPISALGIADSVNAIGFDEATSIAARLPDTTLFAINAGDAATADQTAELFAAAGAATRLCHVVDADMLRHQPRLLDQAKAVGLMRKDGGRYAVNAILHAHDSRLGAADTPMAQIARVAWRAASGDAASQPIELIETGPRDWGWTAEYVDAIARLAALDSPTDLAIGSGHRLDAATMADLAFKFFKADPAGHISIIDRANPLEADVDTARLKAATGWSASTWGRDLVHALCEGAGARGLAR